MKSLEKPIEFFLPSRFGNSSNIVSSSREYVIIRSVRYLPIQLACPANECIVLIITRGWYRSLEISFQNSDIAGQEAARSIFGPVPKSSMSTKIRGRANVLANYLWQDLESLEKLPSRREISRLERISRSALFTHVDREIDDSEIAVNFRQLLNFHYASVLFYFAQKFYYNE